MTALNSSLSRREHDDDSAAPQARWLGRREHGEGASRSDGGPPALGSDDGSRTERGGKGLGALRWEDAMVGVRLDLETAAPQRRRGRSDDNRILHCRAQGGLIWLLHPQGDDDCDGRSGSVTMMVTNAMAVAGGG
uniref:Uncharacterized protein n=1 Tax=Leersia perrieri TaxID=77586 RepID=A0A0D9WR47_9ORYZ